MSYLEDAKPRDQLEGEPVAYWFRPADAQLATGVTSRSLLRYERMGLPSDGSGPTKRYAFPHTLWWLRALKQRRLRGEKPTQVPFDRAAAEHRLVMAQVALADDREDASRAS